MKTQLPSFIQESLFKINNGKNFAYLKIAHNSGLLLEVGGKLKDFGFQEYYIGKSLSYTIPLFAKFFPLKESQLSLPAVEYNSSISQAAKQYMDIYFFLDADTEWVIFLDKTEDLYWQKMAQQKNNELALLCKKLAQNENLTQSKSHADDSLSVFELYNIIPFEQLDQHTFIQLASVPHFHRHNLPESFALNKHIDLLYTFPFLESFMDEANEVWNSQDEQFRKKSGPWVEETQKGDEVVFEVTAAYWQKKKLFLLEFLNNQYYEQHNLLQLGREEALLRQQAELKNKLKSEFLSGMSHELRTPLNAILGFSQLLALADNLQAEQQDNVQEIMSAGEHLLELITGLLDLSKIESGVLEILITSVDVQSVVEECMTLVSTDAAKQGITILNTGLKYATIKADRMRFKQCLLNLLSNAIKYNRGEGHIIIDVQPLDSVYLAIIVKDSGIGMSSEQINDIFQPFHRLGAENTNIEGTGIGLMLTKKMLEMMGGSIIVKSEVGVGSTFCMKLPLNF